MIYLILADLFWSVCALIYDWPKLLNIPATAMIFTIICPLYPLILALYWIFERKKWPSSLLLVFGAIPSAILIILALIYYPTQMIYNGFNLLGLGQIFWVAFYGLQGWYLIFTKKFSSTYVLLTGIFLVIKFTTDYAYKDFGYLGMETLPQNILLTIYLFSLFLVLSVCLFLIFRQTCWYPKDYVTIKLINLIKRITKC